MSILSRIARWFARDPRNALRPLWHRVVEISRDPEWYTRFGVEDTIGGRFDMITAVLALVMLRMESDPALIRQSVLLVELFVEDMDGQLRETGVGDPAVGKHMGRLMSVLGGRLGALRDALAAEDDGALLACAQRNTALQGDAGAGDLAAAWRAFAATLAQTQTADLLSGEFQR